MEFANREKSDVDHDEKENTSPSRPPDIHLQRAQTEALSYVLDEEAVAADTSADLPTWRNGDCERKPNLNPADETRRLSTPGAIAVHPTDAVSSEELELDSDTDDDDRSFQVDVSLTKEVDIVGFSDDATEATDLDSSRFVTRARVVSDADDSVSSAELGDVELHPKLVEGTTRQPEAQVAPTLVKAEPIDEADLTVKQILSNRKVQGCIMIICFLIVGLTVGLILGLETRRVDDREVGVGHGGGHGRGHHGRGGKPPPVQALGDKLHEGGDSEVWNNESAGLPKKSGKKGNKRRKRATRRLRG